MRHRRFHAPSQPARRAGRLSAARERWVYGVLAALWLSGVGWLVARYVLRAASEFGDVPGPLEAWCLRLHGAAGFAGLWLLGWLWAIHFVPAWRARRRVSGIVVAVGLGILVVTGYLLYYAGADDVRQVIALGHWLLGLALLPPLGWHVLRARHADRNGDDPQESADAS